MLTTNTHTNEQVTFAADFGMLPTEIQYYILNFLDRPNLLQASLASHFFNRFIQDYFFTQLRAIGCHCDFTITHSQIDCIDYKTLYYAYCCLPLTLRETIQAPWQLLCLAGTEQAMDYVIEQTTRFDALPQAFYLIIVSGNIAYLNQFIKKTAAKSLHHNADISLYYALLSKKLHVIKFVLDELRIVSPYTEELLNLAIKTGRSDIIKYFLFENSQLITQATELTLVNYADLRILNGIIDNWATLFPGTDNPAVIQNLSIALKKDIQKFADYFSEPKNLSTREDKNNSQKIQAEYAAWQKFIDYYLQIFLTAHQANTARIVFYLKANNFYHCLTPNSTFILINNAVHGGNRDVLNYILSCIHFSLDMPNYTKLIDNAIESAGINMMSYIKSKFPDSQTIVPINNSFIFLCSAVASGNIDVVKLILNTFVIDPWNINKPDTPNLLLLAAHYGQIEIMKYAIDKLKIDVTMTNIYGHDALYLLYSQAANITNISDCLRYKIAARYLTAKGLRLNENIILLFTKFKIDDPSSLIKEIKENIREIHRYSHPMYSSNYFLEIFHLGIIKNYTNFFRALANLPVSVRTSIKKWELLCLSGEPQAIYYAMDKENVRPKAADKSYSIALLYAAFSGNQEGVELLISAGCDPHYISNEGIGLLHALALSGQTWEVLTYFKETYHLNDTAKTHNNKTLFHCIAQSGNLETCKKIIKLYPARLGETTKTGENVCSFAALSGNKKMLDFIISEITNRSRRVKNNDFNYLAMSNNAPLFFQHKEYIPRKISAKLAIMNPNPEILATLTKSLPKSMQKDMLTFAAQSGQVNKVKFFLKFKLSPESKCHALCHAAQCGDLLSVDAILQTANSDQILSVVQHEGLLNAAQSGNVELFIYLIEFLKIYNSLDLNVQTKNGLSLLHCAAMARNKDMLEYLIETLNISSTLLTLKKENALDIAAQHGNIEGITYLRQQGLIPTLTLSFFHFFSRDFYSAYKAQYADPLVLNALTCELATPVTIQQRALSYAQ